MSPPPPASRPTARGKRDEKGMRCRSTPACLPVAKTPIDWRAPTAQQRWSRPGIFKECVGHGSAPGPRVEHPNLWPTPLLQKSRAARSSRRTAFLHFIRMPASYSQRRQGYRNTGIGACGGEAECGTQRCLSAYSRSKGYLHAAEGVGCRLRGRSREQPHLQSGRS